jgi:hypothetical protein
MNGEAGDWELVPVLCRNKFYFVSALRGAPMFRKMICAIAVVGLAVGFAGAQNQAQQGGKAMWGKITKVNGNKISFQAYDPATKKFGEAKELQVNDTALKVYHMKGDKREPLAGGLNAPQLKTIGATGQFATVRVDGNQVAEMWLWDDEASFQKGIQGSKGGAGQGGEKKNGG